jgi:hypothetical protein|tara:strand:- start:6344 stop:7777 length:1434 start_codon:yes stop_codon:yes gene_type:complete
MNDKEKMKKILSGEHPNYTVTENNALQYNDLNKCLTLFSRVGGMRNSSRNVVLKMFKKAFKENPELATQISYWARAAREGSGERNTFYTILDEIAKCSPIFISDNAKVLAELGYYKDLVRYFYISNVVSAFAQSILEKDRLACKWAPRKGENAKKLRDELKFTNKEYRKWLKKYSITLEQQMTNKEWGDINYPSVPGAAMRKYKEAFNKHDKHRFDKWKDDKNSKASVSASYPHQVMKMSGSDDKLSQKLWDNLPDLVIEGENILPMIDVSGSMTGLPMEVAISLGLYLAERNKGNFKNKYLTFSESPTLDKIKGETLAERYKNVLNSHWGMNTDFERAYKLILELALSFDATQEQMPTMLLVLSDMQFDEATTTNPHFENIQREFELAGYIMPKIVFWNLSSSNLEGSPARPTDDGVAMVSGFSPTIMKAVLNVEDFNPIDVMMEALEPIQLDYTNLNDKLDIEYDESTYSEFGWN